MMATEATVEPIAKEPATPDHELNTIKSASQDVPSNEPVINGNIVKEEKEDTKSDTENVESNVISAEVSVSGGSDTEATKTEASKARGGEKSHTRTASTVKKASFKPISVNRTFLTTKAAAPAAPSKLGEKGAAGSTTVPIGSSSGTSARPRLVAKSGSGLRDSAPRTSAAGNGGKTGAPDASAVWNKNRPAPPPEPKRFTDEDLQRVGIHLTARLQGDENKQEKAWADIDDDDDDWAPETIEWTDGTKITLPQAEETPSPVAAPAIIAVSKETTSTEILKPKSPVPLPSPKVRTSGFGGGRAGLVLKGATEKPTLVAKPPGPPTPVKSPWAPLPPVEKVPPVAIEPQQQHAQYSRMGQRDPHNFQAMAPPAKEIAADDFSRSWRGDGPNNARELYNSQSGRYEPVNDTRRGSMRNDARSHQPAVLQRPSQQDGPAEPSSAFQTHRASIQDSGYGSRRRTSSNVSGGSGNFVRRMSRGLDMPPPHELLNVRRGSLAAVSDAPSIESPRTYSPSGQYQGQRGYQNPQWQSRASPVISHSSPQLAQGQTVTALLPTDNQTAVYEDPIEEQKKIMKKTREEAIKRRQEQEAKEEAEKQERIRLKLAAMGPPPETKKSKKETPKLEKAVPTQIQPRDTGVAQATPSVPEAANGLKVTSSEAVDKASASTSPKETPNEIISPLQDTSQDNHINGIQQKQPPMAVAQPSQDSRPSQWQNNSAPPTSDRFKPWAPPSAQQPTSRNVWGPPTNDRTLGNGTFNPELSRLPEMHPSTRPGPIGPPNQNNGNSQFQQGRGRDQYNNRPAPIGPPNRQQPSLSAEDQARKAAVAKSGWGSLPQKLAQDDALAAQQREIELARRRELQAQGVAPEASRTVIKDTWRQVNINEDGSRSAVQANVTTTHGDASANVKGQEDAATRGIFEEAENTRHPYLENVGGPPPFNDAWRSSSTMSAAPPLRGSRFFPNNRDVRLEDPNTTFGRSSSPSPPPPTMAGHPVYDGDSAHPHVSLPKPSPVVKLPPPPVLAPIGPPKPTSFAAAVAAPAVPAVYNNGYGPAYQTTRSYQDTRRQEPQAGNWQDRINNLIGRGPLKPNAPAIAVDSSSKSALEHHLPVAATVSLPSSFSGDLATDDGSIESKPAAEECFEEQEMGSIPTIKVPHTAPASAWTLAPQQPRTLPRKFVVSDARSREPLQFPQSTSNDRSTGTIHIKLLGQEVAKVVSVPLPRQKSNPRRGGGRGGRGAHNRGGRGRDASSGYPSPSLDNASVSSTPNSSGHTNRGGRGGRGFGSNSNWNRRVPTPVHT